MNSTLALALSGKDVGLIFGLAGLLAGLTFGLYGMYLHHRRRELWHQTARLALEKGQPLPPPPMDDDRPSHSQPSGPAGDFRAGLVCVGVGIGLYFFLGLGIAAIVGFVGVALLIYALCTVLFTRKNPPQDPPSRS